MDYFERLVRKIALVTLTGFVFISALAGGMVWYGLSYLPGVEPILILLATATIILIISLVTAQAYARYVTEPVSFLWRAILHVTPEHHSVSAPNVAQARVAKELVTSLTQQIYQLASSAPNHSTQTAAQSAPATGQSNVLLNMPVPMLVVNKNQVVTFANKQAGLLLDMPDSEITGKNMYELLDLSFPNENTFDRWLKTCRASKATATQAWNHVKLSLSSGQTVKQLDIAAFYSKDSPDNTEVVICLSDKTTQYEGNDDDIEFISLAVHELRTPLTMLRGYIEVFQEELEGKLDPELQNYMTKMQASASQLTNFVGNILNVARVEGNQLFLHLAQDSWELTLKQTVLEMLPRAKARGYQIDLSIQPNLPPVAVDKVTISEVINNLLDNAIKYSPSTKKILVRSYLRDDGMIETTVQDFGIGIPSSIIGNLFQKFYRNHRSRTQVGGTGLGLYLSKAIVNAHGGQIWVKSKEGQGSIFGFTLQQYNQLADELKSSDNKDIRRTAYGWIKNHSFYKQ